MALKQELKIRCVWEGGGVFEMEMEGRSEWSEESEESEERV